MVYVFSSTRLVCRLRPSQLQSQQGRYIPVFAAALYDKNAELIEAGLTPINLTSVMIGKQPIIYHVHAHH